jgi:phosphatidate cytidylyltransferase
MLKKYLTALVGIPVLIVFFKTAPLWGFSVFVAAFSLLGLWEVYGLFEKCGLKPARWVGLALGAGFFGLATWLGTQPIAVRGGWLGGAVAVTCIVGSLAVLLPDEDRIPAALGRLASTLAGVFYVPYLMSHFVLLRGLDPEHADVGVNLVFYTLAVVWASDGFAFIVGSAVGRTPLVPTISPKKSVEGAVGGLLGSVLASFVAARVLEVTVFSNAQLGGIGAALGLLGQLGDLVESALKRCAGVKDSGTLFPGHGGILDRADSLVLTAPLVYLYLALP